MTSNVGSQQISAVSGGREDQAAYEAMKRQVTDALRSTFRPEFLNRVDEIIVFHPLTDADLAAIVDLLLAGLQRRLAERDLTLELTPAARQLIAREGTDPAYGARPLKRTIQRLVENPLARALLRGEFSPGDTITADADTVSGTIVFKSDRSTVVAEAGRRRDARSVSEEPEPAGAGAGRGRGRKTVLDLPEIEDAPKRDPGRARQLSDRLSFGSVAARLEGLPRRLPEPPAELMPVRVGESRARSWPGTMGDARPAAVLVLVVPTPVDEAAVVLIERSTGGRHHSGEVSFPGGRAEDADDDLVATAIREAEEEIGLDAGAADLRVAGTIEPFWIPVSNYRVTPVVAIAGPAARAVGVARRGRRDRRGAVSRCSSRPPRSRSSSASSGEWRLRYGGYRIGGLHVWGATARILGQLGAFLA
jgi:8-oxo-dGTP pyrophosphatase MutT (NUDIX family)